MRLALARRLRVTYRARMSDDDDDLPEIKDDKDWYIGMDPKEVGLLHFALGGVFPEWSSNRMAKWLGINPRTLQRMLSRRPEIRQKVPDGLMQRIGEQRDAVHEFELGEQIDDLIKRAQRNRIDDEVIGAWLAHRYKKLMGRDVD